MTRHERPLARPKTQHRGGKEDEPTYVDEDGHSTLSKSQFDALMSSGQAQAEKPSKKPSETQNDMQIENVVVPNPGKPPMAEHEMKAQKTAKIGTSVKRRLPKVVMDNAELVKGEDVMSPASTSEKKLSKKQKKMKLSFDEE